MSNKLIWGGIGEADFSITQSNIRGYMPMPWLGDSYKILPLGNSLVIFGAGGFALGKFISTAFSIERLFDIGVISRTAVASSGSDIIFIDEDYNLRTLDSSLTLSEGMYREYFLSMSSNIMVSYNSLDKEYYITDGTLTYCLTPQGLCKLGQNIISYTRGNKIEYPIIMSNTASTGIITTDVLDFGSRGMKALDVIETGVYSEGSVSLKIDYKLTTKNTWATGPTIALNPEGNVVYPIMGLEFRFTYIFDIAANSTLDYIRPRVKFIDNRYKRGQTYVSTTNP